MILSEKRAHGVTPALNRDYGMRTAEHQAAFLLPYLRPGMEILDVGCGPGSISIGLAAAIAPGQLIGIDHDPVHIQTACALATEQRVKNTTFFSGDALMLPFDSNSFDIVFENNLLTHIAQDGVSAAKEIFRILRPGGIFAARDVDADAVVWGHPDESLKLLDRLFIKWHRRRGSDITIGRRLPVILREAGFSDIIKSVSADTKGTPADTRSHADITISLLDGPFGRDIIQNGWGDHATVDHLKKSIWEWGRHPDAFFANIHVEVIGWKSEG